MKTALVGRIKNKARRLLTSGDFFGARDSFSQCGEDRIIALIFHNLQIDRPTYLDLGANHPVYFSNTYLFYRHGCRGVCVEANPVLARKFNQKRKRDRCLNVGVAAEAGEMTLHVFGEEASGLGTLSSDWAKRAGRLGGYEVRTEIPIRVVGINELLRAEFPFKPPDLLTIDIEGLDEPVLRAIDYQNYLPTVLCVETIAASLQGEKNHELIEFLLAQGYSVFADTWINTILVRQDRFPKF